MTKDQIIQFALTNGIVVKETTYGIWNPEEVFSFEPKREQYQVGMYHVSLDRSRSELLSGVRLMAERMKIELKGFPSK
jgi:hypothetical protein